MEIFTQFNNYAARHIAPPCRVLVTECCANVRMVDGFCKMILMITTAVSDVIIDHKSYYHFCAVSYRKRHIETFHISSRGMMIVLPA